MLRLKRLPARPTQQGRSCGRRPPLPTPAPAPHSRGGAKGDLLLPRSGTQPRPRPARQPATPPASPEFGLVIGDGWGRRGGEPLRVAGPGRGGRPPPLRGGSSEPRTASVDRWAGMQLQHAFSAGRKNPAGPQELGLPPTPTPAPPRPAPLPPRSRPAPPPPSSGPGRSALAVVHPQQLATES